MDKTSQLISMLAQQPGFKITSSLDLTGTLIVEADGVIFQAGYVCVEEALFDAYITIMSTIKAREMVKSAKIVL